MGSVPSAGHLSRYVTSHLGQLSLAIHVWVGAIGTSQRAVTLCGWGVKAGIFYVCMAGKIVRSHCCTGAISEFTLFISCFVIFRTGLNSHKILNLRDFCI